MTWIQTVSLSEADEKLRRAIEGEKSFYPKEYALPVHPDRFRSIFHCWIAHSNS